MRWALAVVAVLSLAGCSAPEDPSAAPAATAAPPAPGGLANATVANATPTPSWGFHPHGQAPPGPPTGPVGEPMLWGNWSHPGTATALPLFGLPDKPCLAPGRQGNGIEAASWDAERAVAVTAEHLGVTVGPGEADGWELRWRSADGSATARTVSGPGISWYLLDGPDAGTVDGLRPRVEALLAALDVPSDIGYRAELKSQDWRIPREDGATDLVTLRWLDVLQTADGAYLGHTLLRVDLTLDGAWRGLAVYAPTLVAGQVDLVEPEAYSDAADEVLRCVDPEWERRTEWRATLIASGSLVWRFEAEGPFCQHGMLVLDAITGASRDASVSCTVP